MFDKFHEECGVVGVSGHPRAAMFIQIGLRQLQHRGQEGAGMAMRSVRGDIEAHRGQGLVNEVMTKEVVERLEEIGDTGIGHNRYSTAGGSTLVNIQPIVAGSIAIAHNGNLVNAGQLRCELEQTGALFSTTSDTEVILHLMARASGLTVGRLRAALDQVQGAYSLLLLTEHEMVAVRDPHGFRPLVLGRINGGLIVASETCAIRGIKGAAVEREIEPGEILVIRGSEVVERTIMPAVPRRSCVFEGIYFARPDSDIGGEPVINIRLNLGRQLAIDAPAEADLVVPVLDSGEFAALGYSRVSGIEYLPALIRTHFSGRTFIEPDQLTREFKAHLKHGVSSVLKGRRIVLVDDSIVRATTSKVVIELLREEGVREVHFRVSSPPIVGPCYFGIDTPTTEELVASRHSVEEICRFIGADSLGYLTLAGLYRAVGAPGGVGICASCFTGKYPGFVPR